MISICTTLFSLVGLLMNSRRDWLTNSKIVALRSEDTLSSKYANEEELGWARPPSYWFCDFLFTRISSSFRVSAFSGPHDPVVIASSHPRQLLVDMRFFKVSDIRNRKTSSARD